MSAAASSQAVARPARAARRARAFLAAGATGTGTLPGAAGQITAWEIVTTERAE